ncbi:hypothetical protein HMPREF9412_3375 [Paenibacillus sp. HGF5]|nr:hypothetical protein HMPREF9412_3375 [Paenibacillus sp. HGF5]
MEEPDPRVQSHSIKRFIFHLSYYDTDLPNKKIYAMKAAAVIL